MEKISFKERRCAKDVVRNYGSLNIEHRKRLPVYRYENAMGKSF